MRSIISLLYCLQLTPLPPSPPLPVLFPSLLQGYAKLIGRIFYVDDEARAKGVREEDFDAIITALPARLGRHQNQPPPMMKGEEGGGKEGEGEGCFVALGTTKKVSRHHATINWDFIKGCYVIRCFSKNGMVRLGGDRGKKIDVSRGSIGKKAECTRILLSHHSSSSLLSSFLSSIVSRTHSETV